MNDSKGFEFKHPLNDSRDSYKFKAFGVDHIRDRQNTFGPSGQSKFVMGLATDAQVVCDEMKAEDSSRRSGSNRSSSSKRKQR